MPDSDTLLAYLVSSFPGNTENIATEALRHIFDQSDACLEALNDVVQSGVRSTSPITVVKSQVTKSDGSRPDLVGYDETGAERVFVEVKFWAGLTPKQPNDYIKHLPYDGPAVVMFLAPEERIQSLWPQLRERLVEEFSSSAEIDSERKCLRVGDTQKHLLIASWGSLLDSMAARTRDFGESGVETEIRQLRSLAKYADTGAFKPIRRGEEFGAEAEVRQRQYKRLIDAATERGIELEWASRKRLRARTREYGYGRYIKLGGLIVWFGINVEQFEKTGDTPLWIDCHYSRHVLTAEISNELGIQESYWVPVNLKRDVEYPAMLDGVVESLQRIADVFQKAQSPPT